MRVKHWMTKSAPVIKIKSNVGDALKVMDLFGVGELAVVDDENKFVGILNREDIVKLPSERSIEDFVILPELYVHPDDTIEAALLGFMETSEEFVPVVDEELKVIGMVTLQDILESMLEITAMDEPGCRISILLEDVPGELFRVIKALSNNGMNILSVLTHREDGKRRVVIKVDTTKKEDAEMVLKENSIDYDSIIEEEGF